MSRVLGFGVRDVAAADQDLPAVDVLESGEHPQRGGFAAAGRADEDEELAVLDVQVELIDRGDVRAGKEPGRAVIGDCCHEK